MRHELAWAHDVAEFANNSLVGDTVKIPASILIVASLLLISCGRPAPPRDFAKMAALVKVGMTKEEVIRAIGNPDKNTQDNSEFQKETYQGHFIFNYFNGPKVLTASFKFGKVFKIFNQQASY